MMSNQVLCVDRIGNLQVQGSTILSCVELKVADVNRFLAARDTQHSVWFEIIKKILGSGGVVAG
ncbi:hypothetical protein AUI06_02345 [archaeon 13_2_20CM_2_52_21]|nr:MAG: hypothetical protein AUI06_02345 [archaeon 13_2_20CM_2_52_21]